MTTLGELLILSPRFARSVNIERDITQTEPLDGYVVTARALEVIERIATTAARSSAGGAWSITGPYGSGKSSLAVLIDGAFGPAGRVQQRTLDLIGEVSPEIATEIGEAHARHGTSATGFNRAVVTANREPISLTILRALHSAVLRRFGKIPRAGTFPAARALRAALSDVESRDPRRTGPSPAALLEVARCLADDAPLLLVVDEFGKNLEAVDQSSDTDPYLLQQIAEAGQGAGSPIFTLTLQHLSFEDYFLDTDGPQQREWAKVQGRFEDIPYVDSPEQTRALIGTVFGIADPDLRARIVQWAGQAAAAMSGLGIADLADPPVVADCYPLHPLAAAVLPELCSRFGQNERTLFSFLTGPDRAGAATFLADCRLAPSGDLPVIGLPEVYDYFVAGGVIGRSSGSQSSRWTEVATRLRDTHGLTDRQSDLAKTIAVLNLVAVSGALRASRELLAMALPNADQTLAELELVGLVTYRKFADEYRLWQGSDVDLRQLLDQALEQAAHPRLVEILGFVGDPHPVVAARHSAQHDVLRSFSQRYVHGDEIIEPLSPFAAFDGEVLLVVGGGGQRPIRAPAAGPSKPTVVAVPGTIERLDAAARILAAIHTVIEDPSVAADWVARTELSERLAQAEAVFNAAIEQTFRSESCGWFLLTDSGSEQLPGGRGSAALSAAADRVYPDTPIVRNEMLNRTELSSQGARARRLVLEGMLERTSEPDLGFSGYGPEVAMSRAVLDETGLHRKDSRHGAMAFAAPKDPTLVPAWKLLEAEFRRARSRRVNLNDLYAALMSPPIGMKAAVVPVFVTAGLLAFADEVAIYEHGTFRPTLSPAISERMVRNPNHFDVKHFANASGARRAVVEALAAALGVAPRFRKHRVANVLAIVGHLVAHIGRLDNYTLRTVIGLSDSTRELRDVLVTAVEPDELLFDLLPVALGFPVVGADADAYPERDRFSRAVRNAVGELESMYSRLLDELLGDLLDEIGETKVLAVAGMAASIADEVLDRDVRAFVLTLANDGAGSDQDWIQSIATVVSKRAPAEWTDEDRRRYSHELPTKIAAFQRIVALHADYNAHGGGAFGVVRVTFTRPDGREGHRLAVVEDSDRPLVEHALEAALETLRGIEGSEYRARLALLALLSEEILPSVSPAAGTEAMESIGERMHHG